MTQHETEAAHPPRGLRRRLAAVPYRWVATAMVMMGMFMVVLDTTIVNLGLPAMQRDFGVTDGIEWVVTSYLAAVGVALTVSGWLADRFGRRQVLIAAMAMFTVTSLLCAIAPTFVMLVVARLLQGLAGGVVLPVAMAMVYELFDPEERGKALGYFGVAMMAAPALGPVLGGGLVSALSWRWLFLINVPVGLVAVPLAIRLLRDTGFRESRRFDWTGLALGGVGLSLFLVAMSQGGAAGWSHPAVVAGISVGVVLMALFVRHLRGTEAPLVDVRIIAHPVFAISMVAVALMTVAQFVRLVYIPLLLGAERDISELRIGIAMLPSAVGMAAALPIGGRLVDRVGARIPLTVGGVVFALSFVALAQVELSTSLVVIAAILFGGGLGAGLAVMAPSIVAMNSVSARYVSQASALSNVARQVSAAIGVAIMGSVFASASVDQPADAGEVMLPYRVMFYIAVGSMVLVLVVAQFLPGKERALQLQAERRADETEYRDEPALPTEVW